MKWLIAITAVLILLAACSEKTIVEESAKNVLEEETRVIELRLIDNEFDPNTIVVSEGDNVKLQFMNVDPFMFSLPGFEINEKVNGNNFIEFVADKKGFFDFACGDCNKTATGILKVI